MNKRLTKPQIFLLHHAGGNKYSFRLLINQLAPLFQIEALELPGRGERLSENFLINYQQATMDLFKQIKKKRFPNTKYLIYGHSMGAKLGLEVCQMMEHIADPPCYFIATGYPGPNVEDFSPISHLPSSGFFKLNALKCA